MELIPYAASLGFYRAEAEAVKDARRSPNRGRFMRIGSEEEPTALTVPVEGGLKSFRHGLRRYDELTISDHGKWQHVHLGALDALYGRAPYFHHYFPLLESLLRHAPRRLADLNRGVDDIISRALHIDSYRSLIANPTAAVAEEARMLRGDSDSSLSMVHYLMQMGPEAIFLLI